MMMSGKTTRRSMLAVFFRWCLGGLFLYAGIMKAHDPAGFALVIYNYKLLPGWMVNPLAIVLPWVEILAGLCLVLGVYLTGGTVLVTGLLVIFAGALGINAVRGLDVACGCFSGSAGGDPVTWRYLARDLVLLCMGLYVFFFDRGSMSFAGVRRR